MSYEEEINRLMKSVEKYIAVFLYEQLELCITITFEEEKNLVLVRERILADLPKYVAPLALEKVNLIIRRVLASLIREEEDLFKANETDSEEEEDEEDNILPDMLESVSPVNSSKTKKMVPLVSPNEETI